MNPRLTSLISGATIVIASSAFALAACSSREATAGELLDIATQSLNESGFKLEKGLEYGRSCRGRDTGTALLGTVTTCNARFSGAVIKDNLRYQAEVSCAPDAASTKDCRVYSVKPL